MIELNDEYRKVADEFKKTFGYGVPLNMIPGHETNEQLIKNLRKCIDEKCDTLDEIYDIDNSEHILY